MTFSSAGNTLEDILYALAELDEADCYSFPSANIVHIGRTVTIRKKLTRRLIKNFFKGDLVTYTSDIASCCSGATRLLEWPADERQEWSEYLSKNFFQRYYKYLPMRRWITDTSTPELFRDFVLHEEMRVNVLAFLRLLDELESQNKDGNRTS